MEEKEEAKDEEVPKEEEKEEEVPTEEQKEEEVSKVSVETNTESTSVVDNERLQKLLSEGPNVNVLSVVNFKKFCDLSVSYEFDEDDPTKSKMMFLYLQQNIKRIQTELELTKEELDRCLNPPPENERAKLLQKIKVVLFLQRKYRGKKARQKLRNQLISDLNSENKENEDESQSLSFTHTKSKLPHYSCLHNFVITKGLSNLTSQECKQYEIVKICKDFRNEKYNLKVIPQYMLLSEVNEMKIRINLINNYKRFINVLDVIYHKELLFIIQDSFPETNFELLINTAKENNQTEVDLISFKQYIIEIGTLLNGAIVQDNLKINDITASSLYLYDDVIMIDPLSYNGRKNLLYYPPEKFISSYISQQQSIVWTYGVIIHYLYKFELPFRNIYEIVQYSVKKKLLYSNLVDPPNILKLIEGLLHWNPTKRLKIEDVITQI